MSKEIEFLLLHTRVRFIDGEERLHVSDKVLRDVQRNIAFVVERRQGNLYEEILTDVITTSGGHS